MHASAARTSSSSVPEIEREFIRISLKNRNDSIADDTHKDDGGNNIDLMSQPSGSKSILCDEIDSDIPTDFNDDNHIFHINFMQSMQNIINHDKRFKNGTRRSCTFSNERVRQIERENRILLRKILTHGPSYTIGLNSKQQLAQNRSSNSSRVSSAAINRRKQQEKIDYNNGILKKKIERIANRTSK